MAARGEKKWKFVFVVRGAGKRALEAESADLDNVLVLDYQPASWTADLLWAADLHLLTMKKGWEGVVVPSKLYGALTTGAPALFIGPEMSGTAEEIRRYRAGVVLPPGVSGSAVADALQRLFSDPPGSKWKPSRDGVRQLASFITDEHK